MWWSFCKFVAYVWRRTGDLSVIAWVFPGWWTTLVSLGVSTVTTIVAIATGVPKVLWIFLGIFAYILMLLAAHLKLWLTHRRSIDVIYTPSEIIFDLKNPGQQFWKRISATDEKGKPIGILILEYRIGISVDK
jgi:hypothetical protein